MALLILFIVWYVLLSISLMKVFEKAGESPTKALIPGVNFVVWCKLIGRKPIYALLLLVPIVNFFIMAGMEVDLARSFGRNKLWEAALAVVFSPILFFLIGRTPEDQYLGPVLEQEAAYLAEMEAAKNEGRKADYNKLARRNPYAKDQGREWIEAIVFAVFAAAFIRLFFIEAYNIPTSSMEGSMNVGDFLFVSKWSYGFRTPETVAMLPLLHNRVPFLNIESYNSAFALEPKRWRLSAGDTLTHNAPVVFNYPEGDSVYLYPGRTWSIHDTRRNPEVKKMVTDARLPLVTRPVDKMDHYVKRTIGLPGDVLEIRDRQVYINGKAAENPENLQYIREVVSSTPFKTDRLRDIGISLEDQRIGQNGNAYYFPLNDDQAAQLKAWDPTVEINPVDLPTLFGESSVYPHRPDLFGNWTRDNMGPIRIPKRGMTINLDPKNVAMYKRAITAYEGNELRMNGSQVILNGKPATEYTFKLDYYWMMGDNRHNSEDSRIWGFVPETHIVGAPKFVWFSTKEGNIFNGLNFDRMFRPVSSLAK